MAATTTAPRNEVVDLQVTTDRTDFGAACEAEHASLLRFGYLLTGDPQQAEDLVADSLARVLPKWQTGRVASLGPYTRRAMVNGLRGGLRRRYLERREAAKVSGDARGARAFDDTLVDRDQLHRALLRLPPRQRAAVVLRYVEDLRELEVAGLLGISVGTVKSSVSRGLDRLRAVLEEEASA